MAPESYCSHATVVVAVDVVVGCFVIFPSRFVERLRQLDHGQEPFFWMMSLVGPVTCQLTTLLHAGPSLYCCCWKWYPCLAYPRPVFLDDTDLICHCHPHANRSNKEKNISWHSSAAAKDIQCLILLLLLLLDSFGAALQVIALFAVGLLERLLERLIE